MKTSWSRWWLQPLFGEKTRCAHSPWTWTKAPDALWFVCLRGQGIFSGLMEKSKLMPSFLECRTCVIFWVPGILELSFRVWLQGLCGPHFLLLTADYSISLYTQPRGWGKSGWLRRVLPKGSIWTDPSHNSLWCMTELGVRREGRVSGETGPRARVSLLY